MRYFFLFSPMFHEWPLAIARRIFERSSSAEFMGLVFGKERVCRRVEGQQNPLITPLYRLHALEKEWLKTPFSREELVKYEKIFGQEILNRLVISSRQIGSGWVTGATVSETRLMRMSRDTDVIRRYVLGLLNFLFRVFDERRPDLVFCYVVSEAPAYCMSKVSEHFGVPFRRLTPTRVGTQYILDDSPEGLLGPVCRTYKNASNDPKDLLPFLPEAKNFLKHFRSTPEKPEYQLFNERIVQKKRSLLAIPGQLSRVLLAALKVIRPHREWAEPTDWSRRSWILRVNLKSLQLSLRSPFRPVGEIPDQPFAYFPLHVDPEESTMLYAPYQTNQLAVIESLSKSLPLGMDLVVKEHPAMMGRRPSGFYRALSRIPKVILVSAHERPFELIRRAALTCVITGTAGWEAMMLQKPVIVLGENFPYLQVGQGVDHCPELSKLPSVILSAMQRPPASEESLELFIASVLYHSFDLPANLLWEKVSPGLIEKHETILEILCDRLQATDYAEGDKSAGPQ